MLSIYFVSVAFAFAEPIYGSTGGNEERLMDGQNERSGIYSFPYHMLPSEREVYDQLRHIKHHLYQLSHLLLPSTEQEMDGITEKALEIFREVEVLKKTAHEAGNSVSAFGEPFQNDRSGVPRQEPDLITDTSRVLSTNIDDYRPLAAIYWNRVNRLRTSILKVQVFDPNVAALSIVDLNSQIDELNEVLDVNMKLVFRYHSKWLDLQLYNVFNYATAVSTNRVIRDLNLVASQTGNLNNLQERIENRFPRETSFLSHIVNAHAMLDDLSDNLHLIIKSTRDGEDITDLVARDSDLVDGSNQLVQQAMAKTKPLDEYFSPGYIMRVVDSLLQRVLQSIRTDLDLANSGIAMQFYAEGVPDLDIWEVPATGNALVVFVEINKQIFLVEEFGLDLLQKLENEDPTANEMIGSMETAVDHLSQMTIDVNNAQFTYLPNAIKTLDISYIVQTYSNFRVEILKKLIAEINELITSSISVEFDEILISFAQVPVAK